MFVTQLAVDYRMQFNKDVVIDLVCYRRRGHNEAEEPAKTQPLMYDKIRKLPTTRTQYAEKLIAQGVIDKAEDRALVDNYRRLLGRGWHVPRCRSCTSRTKTVRRLAPVSRWRTRQRRRHHGSTDRNRFTELTHKLAETARKVLCCTGR